MTQHTPHKLSFKMQQTSVGYLGQGVEIPAIIVESKSKQQLKDDLDVAIQCYFKSFPEEHDKIFGKESIEIEQFLVTI